MISNINLEKLSAFTVTLKNMIDQLGMILQPYIISIFKLMTSFLHLSIILRDPTNVKNQAIEQEGMEIEQEQDPDQDQEQGQKIDILQIQINNKLKKLYHNSIKRLCQIISRYPSLASNAELMDTLIKCLEQNIEKVHTDTGSNIPYLLKLFLVWGENTEYIDYFLKYKFIIPALSKIYTQSKNGKKMINAVNDIFDNICKLTITNEFENNDENNNNGMQIEPSTATYTNDKVLQEKCNNILKENLDHLINNMNTYFTYQIQASKKKLWKPDFKTIRILVKLSEFISSSEYADKFLILFKPILESNYINKLFRIRDRDNQKNVRLAEKSVEVIKLVIKIFNRLFEYSQHQESYYSTLLNLIMGLNVQTPREDIINCMEKLHKEKFSLTEQTITNLKGLNAYNRASERTLNWAIVIPICYKINTQFIQNSNFSDLEVILYQYLFFLKQEELSARIAAVNGIKLFFDIFRSDVENNICKEQQRKLDFIFKVFLNEMIKALKLRHEYQLKSHLELINYYIIQMSYLVKNNMIKDVPNIETLYLDLACLQNKNDPFQDFFTNIFDIQNHMRLKALNILNKKLKEIEDNKDNISEDKIVIHSFSIKNIIVPVLRLQILEKHLQENYMSNFQKKNKGNTQFSNSKTLVTYLIETFSSCLKLFKWTQYFQVMKQNLITLKKEHKYEKVIVRLISSNLNHLNFKLNDIVEIVSLEMKKQNNDVNSSTLMNKLLQYESTDQDLSSSHAQLDVSIQNQNKDTTLVSVIIDHLRRQVLGPLRRHMHDKASTENKESKIRVYTAIAITKLVCKMPLNIFNVEFPRLIGNICESLKSRDFEIRNNARKALGEITKITGPYFLHFVIKELSSSLTLGKIF